MAIERPPVDIASSAAGRAARPQEPIADRDGRPDYPGRVTAASIRLLPAARSNRHLSRRWPSMAMRRQNGLIAVFDPIPLAYRDRFLKCRLVALPDLIKLDGEDYRHHQTSLGARKPAHSSAGGGGGGGGTPRK